MRTLPLIQHLTAQDDTSFQFRVDGEGNYGYLKGDGTFSPFSSKRETFYIQNYGTRTYNITKSGKLYFFLVTTSSLYTSAPQFSGTAFIRKVSSTTISNNTFPNFFNCVAVVHELDVTVGTLSIYIPSSGTANATYNGYIVY